MDIDDGSMQFVASEADDPVADVVEARPPFLTRGGMRAVLAWCLELHQGRNASILSKRLVIHT